MFLRRRHVIRFCALGMLLWCAGNLSHAQDVPTGEQLQQLLAPIALYPDPLLAQITAASADPQQILDVDAWLKQNSALQGQALMGAAQKQGFDPAFIALVTFPTVLDAMARNINDYAAIGAANKADPAAVTAAIQALRQQAYSSGALDSNQYQDVSVQQQDGAPVVIVQPANPQVVYVPVYQPEVVFAATPPIVTAPLITFGAGIGIGYLLAQPWGWNSWGWGWGGRGVLWQNNVWRYNTFRYRSPRPWFRPRPPAFGRPIYARPPPNWSQRPGFRPPPPGFRPPGPAVRPPSGRPPSSGSRPPSQGRPPNVNNRPGSNAGRPQGPSTRPPPRNPYAGFSQGGNRPQTERPPPATVGSRPSGYGGNNNGNQARTVSARGRASSGNPRRERSR